MFFFLVAALVAILVIKTIYHFSYWTRHGVANWSYPKLGWLYMTFDQFILSLKKEHKLVGSFKFFNKVLNVNDAQIAKDLSIKELHKFPIRFDTHFGENSLGRSLFFLEADHDWKRIRNIITPAFTSGKLKAMVEPISEIGDKLIEHLKKNVVEGSEFNIKPFIDGFTMDVIARCAYGIDIDSVTQPDHPVIQNARKILNINVDFKQATCVLIPWLAKVLRWSFFDNKAVEFFDQLTETIIEKRLENGSKNHTDLIGLMMKELDDGKNGITLPEMSAQSVLFFIAGYDTTNSAFDHLIYFLARNPEWQDKLYEELTSNELNYERLQELPILNALINETLRLKPSLTIVERVAKEDCTLLDTGIPIEKNTTISIQPFIIHRDPDYFENPDEFLPERFIATNLESSAAYMPFGVGSRLCVGMRFALNELRIGVSKFFLNYTVSIRPDFEMEYFIGSILLSPRRLDVTLKQR